ncbi:MAG: PDZ domain-containing protein [Candidatus Latescibacterota bacterium]
MSRARAAGGSLIGFLWALAGASQELGELPATLPARYGILGMRCVSVGPDTLVVDRLFPKGPAEQAGLRRGDRVLGLLPYRTRTLEDLTRLTQSHPPGAQVELRVEREGRALTLPCRVTDVGHLFFLMGEERGLPHADSLAGRWAAPPGGQAARRAGLAEVALRELLDAQGAADDLLALQSALVKETRRYGADDRLEVVERALVQPLGAMALATEAADRLDSTRTLPECLGVAAGYLDLPWPHGRPSPWTAPPAGDPTNVVRHLTGVVAAAGAQVDSAFARLSASERASLLEGLVPLLRRCAESGHLDDGEQSEVDAHVRTLRLAKRLDLERFCAAAGELAELADPRVLKDLRHAAGRPGATRPDRPLRVQGELLHASRSPQGWVLVGGPGPNYYGEEAAVVLDLGGDDVYRTGGGRGSVHLLIDYAGDDLYLGSGPGAPGAALGGVTLLLDLQGSDVYRGDDLAQGAACCGIAVLCDLEGNDVYVAGTHAQGAALFGAGLLLDSSGSDLYASAQRCQGYGGPGGFGLLCDRSGEDRYLADWRSPSHYATPGAWRGWAQGVGCGLRGFAAGGVGLLLDRHGGDGYQAGEFSQGVGYFFGVGMLVDEEGDDVYHGRRYAQGAAAHQAAGLLADRRGNDVYRAVVAASQGAGWDAAVGMLDEGGGNDRYQGGELAQGAAAMNGLGVLLDWGGSDTYCATSGQGHGGATEYWGGRQAPNLGILLDAGGSGDRYDVGGRTDGGSLTSAGTGVFADR